MAKWLRRPTVNRKIPSSTLGGEVFLFFFFCVFYPFLKIFWPVVVFSFGGFALDMHEGVLWVRWWDCTYSPSLVRIALFAFKDGFQC